MNFRDLYQKIKSIEEAGPAMMDPNAIMQQQMGAMQAKMPNLDPATMMKNQQARMAQMKAKQPVSSQGTWTQQGVPAGQPAAPTAPTMPVPPTPPQATATTTGGTATTRTSTAPAAAPTQDVDWEESIDNTPEKPVEECGPMGPSGMMGMRDQQQDSVNMNLSMNGQGVGGIRDLMSILKNIETGGSADRVQPDNLELDIKSMPHPHEKPDHSEHDGLVFGNDMEEEYANQPDEMYSTIDDITNIGSNAGRGDNERPKVNGGGNPYTATSEGIKRQLQNLYQEDKSR